MTQHKNKEKQKGDTYGYCSSMYKHNNESCPHSVLFEPDTCLSVSISVCLLEKKRFLPLSVNNPQAALC